MYATIIMLVIGLITGIAWGRLAKTSPASHAPTLWELFSTKSREV